MKLKENPYIREVLGGLGDVNCPDYDGGFVFIQDQTGEPELEYVQTPCDDSARDWDCPGCRGSGSLMCTEEGCPCEGDGYGDEATCVKCRGDGVNPELRWTVYRVCVEHLKEVRKDDHMYLVPFRYEDSWPHPLSAYEEWFTKDLASVASFAGTKEEELRADLVSFNPMTRAYAMETLAGYFGWHEFDSDPLLLSHREIQERYEDFDTEPHVLARKEDP